ncbi:uncharacterized protein LOC104886911 [Beta vulgaris subsp. vulgaris]|uniref:uncharacterized protein LOC104886911 n=1 Tax=Beta vulgaris subsp. vulgaris TaxID=3555 RepID=UPI002036FE58|nr:uncharacterized protein LOC104886911 [Beta vulgaris subsp. vulgaris]
MAVAAPSLACSSPSSTHSLRLNVNLFRPTTRAVSKVAVKNTSLYTNDPRPHVFLHLSKFPTSTHIPKATSEQGPDPASDPEPSSTSDDFDSRISQVRLKYKSGTGKKAETRKMKKGKQEPGSGSSGSGSVFLPPVPLKEPLSGGLKVDFGFSPYSERVNGRLAGIGLVALLLVELATGKSVVKYHTPAIVFTQVYFMAAASALYLKYEKEKVSVWPQIDDSTVAKQ